MDIDDEFMIKTEVDLPTSATPDQLIIEHSPQDCIESQSPTGEELAGGSDLVWLDGYECFLCNYITTNKELLAPHLASDHSLDLSSNGSQEGFRSRYLARKTAPYPEDWTCDKCLRIFSRLTSIEGHMKKMHPEEFTLACSFCSKWFYDKQMKFRHETMKHKSNPAKKKMKKAKPAKTNSAS